VELCSKLLQTTVGSQTPDEEWCADGCIEVTAVLAEAIPSNVGLAIAVAAGLGCAAVCELSVQDADATMAQFTDVLCERMLGGGNTADWCDMGAGAGPGGTVTFYASSDTSGPGISTLHCLEPDPVLSSRNDVAAAQSIRLEGRDIWWKCSGSGSGEHTRANNEQSPFFAVDLVQQNKQDFWGNVSSTCRLKWNFP